MESQSQFLKLFWITLMLQILAITVLAQTVKREGFTPPVIRLDRNEPVIYEAHITGNHTSVVFEYDGTDRSMLDNGIGNDALANDGIYTITFEANEITSKLTGSDVFRPFVGFVKVFQGSDLLVRYNVIAEIWTDEIQLVEIKQLDMDVQVSPNIVNIKGTVSNDDTRPWAKKFYNYFEDDYDFLNIIFIPALTGNRFHTFVNNSITGIGITIIDASGQYGSSGKLQGITFFPISIFFDGAEIAYLHELGHQWINFLHNTPLEPGIPHWPLGDLASGIMGFSLAGGVGGQFNFDLIPEGNDFRLVKRNEALEYNDLELYLMGLLPPDSVGLHFVFDNQDQSPHDGALFEGPVTYVSIDDIISVLGPRDPDFSTSPKMFRLATIVVSEKLLSPEAMAFYNFFSQRAELKKEVIYSSGLAKGTTRPFYVATGGRGELNTRIEATPAIPTLASPADGDTNISINPTLSWHSSTDASTYRLIVSTEESFTTTIFDESTLSETAKQIGPIANNTIYYWRVNAKNLAGTSPYSETFKFTTLIQVPNQVTLIEPPHLAVIERNSMVFKWNQSEPEVTNYWFEIATDSILSNPIIDSTLSDTIKIITDFTFQNYWWRVRAKNHSGFGLFSETRKLIVDLISGVKPSTKISNGFENYPNPFIKETTIKYSLPSITRIKLVIHNFAGQYVTTLVDEVQSRGIHYINWDGRDENGQEVARGIYFCYPETKEFIQVEKLVVL